MRSLRLLLAPFGFVLGGDLRRRIQPRLGPDGLSGHEARDGHRTFSRSVLVGLAGTKDDVLADEWISNSRVLGRKSRVKDREGPAFWTREESSTEGRSWLKQEEVHDGRVSWNIQQSNMAAFIALYPLSCRRNGVPRCASPPAHEDSQ